MIEAAERSAAPLEIRDVQHAVQAPAGSRANLCNEIVDKIIAELEVGRGRAVRNIEERVNLGYPYPA